MLSFYSTSLFRKEINHLTELLGANAFLLETIPFQKETKKIERVVSVWEKMLSF